MQFLSENRLNGCQIFGWFVLKTESEPNFGFPHIPLLARQKVDFLRPTQQQRSKVVLLIV